MGRVKRPEAARLICALMGPPGIPRMDVKERMVARFGPVILGSDEYPFNFTDYYRDEMGRDLVKFFWAFGGFFDQEGLADAKLFTNTLEEGFGEYRRGRLHRVVNIDPGYVTPSQLVLATTKGYSHRIYLARGIYAEVTLLYRKGRFTFLEWTYPDYRTPLVLAFMEKVREGILAELRNEG